MKFLMLHMLMLLMQIHSAWSRHRFPKGCYVLWKGQAIYKGRFKYSEEGVTCQRWDKQYPHRHNYTKPSLFHEKYLEDAKNYCRDPAGYGLPWCIPKTKGNNFRKCGIPECDDCYIKMNGRAVYTGTVNRTITGKACQYWSSQIPNKHAFSNVTYFPDQTISDTKNYCRDPDKSGKPWCYAGRTKKPRWEKCGVKICKGG